LKVPQYSGWDLLPFGQFLLMGGKKYLLCRFGSGLLPELPDTHSGMVVCVA
jgi:hypothetical protein